MTDKPIKKDPMWFVILIKIICAIIYIPLMIADCWLFYIYVSGDVTTKYHMDTTKELFTRPYFIIPVTILGMIILCWDFYKKLTYKQK